MGLCLRILQGHGAGQVLNVPSGQPITLGRSGAASYAFDDPLLSRKHCAIETRGELCRIRDLESRNGTFVNGERVGAVLLKLGDRVKIGNLLFEVSPAGSLPREAPPSLQGGGTPVRPQGVRSCEGCNQPLVQEGQELDGKLYCLTCFDRYDVEVDLVEGFKILERRAVTSFGVSYLARQLLMDRTVILKVIERGPDTEANATRRFMREAKTGGRLNHPHIVELYDVNEQDGLLYIVTEYVPGQTLAEIMSKRQAPVPLPQGLRVMNQIADALDYAHQNQIIHRDVQPGNLLVRTADLHAKLQGFVLAKNLERAGLSIITADGESLGTPFYMPPEQVRSAKAAEKRSDVYSWGATTYHCLSGKLPLEARSYGDFIDKVFKCEAPPLSQHLPQAPQPLVELLSRALQREPDQRPSGMKEVMGILQPILASFPVP